MSATVCFAHFQEINFLRLNFLLQKYDKNIEKAWSGFTRQDLISLGLRSNSIDTILTFRDEFCPETYLDFVKSKNIEIIDVFSARYPEILKEIYDPPLIIYKKGPLELSDLNGISIVGTRKPTPYGLKAVNDLVEKLAVVKSSVISGMAEGVDTEAHECAIKNNIPTVAVLGTGVDFVYPYSNKKLYETLVNEQAVISEFPIGKEPLKWHFPRRNRVITGLSSATFVIEGTMRSGALISGKLALEQNRDVYALPGNIYSEMSQATNWLIDQGAKPLINFEQAIMETFSLKFDFLKERGKQPKLDLNNEELLVYNAIDDFHGVSIDYLLENTKFEFAKLFKNIISLELKGVISQLPGQKIIRA